MTPTEAGQLAADKLLGTCNGLQNLPNELLAFEDSSEFCAALDDRVFECTDCGWWFEQPAHDNPETSEWVCEECCGGHDE